MSGPHPERRRPERPAGLWPAGLSGPAERRARLLAAMLVSLVALAATALVVVLIVDPAGTPRRAEYGVLITVVLAVLTGALLLNNAGHYRPAAVLTVACALVAPWASAMLDPAVFSGDFVPLTYVVVPVLLCGILLSAPLTAAVTCVQLAGLVACAVLLSPAAPINWPSLCIMVLMVSALSIVANLMIRTDMDQILAQNRQLEENEVLLREQSVRDHVSGLFNRRYLEETLERELRRAARDDDQVAVVMIDLDRFKELNDAYGHAAGDLVLREVGTLVRTNLRYADIACRYGGDELTLILPGAPRDVALARAELLRRRVGELPLTWGGASLGPVTLSAGVCVFPDDGSTGATLLAAGDEALYCAKRDGRDRVCDAAAGGGDRTGVGGAAQPLDATPGLTPR